MNKKNFYILMAVLFSALFFLINLHKVAGYTFDNLFSFKNIFITFMIIMLGLLIGYIIEKR